MNILLIGSGGREHALAWKMKQSPIVDEVWSAPGNPGLNAAGPCFDVQVTDTDGLERLALQLDPDLVIIGPEQPLADGLADRLRARGYDVFGPGADAARIEASKGFSKDLMAKYDIPTARYQRVTDLAAGKAFLSTLTAPYVLKADGLYAGKGVVIAATRDEADRELAAMLSGSMGKAGSEVVIEEFMQGEEASVFAVTDGTNVVLLPAVQDHKRVGEGDTGPNTGGMGAYAPAPVITPDLMETVLRTIVLPTLAGMTAENCPFQGVLYVGLMITADGPKVVEYNCRFGDPECQVLMAGLEGDIVPLLLASSTGGMNADDFAEMAPQDGFRPTAGVVLASNGYPGAYAKGSVIEGVEAAGQIPGVTVFHAGTDIRADGALVSAGGRVLTVTASAATLDEAFAQAYGAVDAISWPEGFCRRDIGWRVRTAR